METAVPRRDSIIRRLSLMVGMALVAAVVAVGGMALLEQQRQLTRALETKATSLAQFMAQVSPISILSLNFVEMNLNVKKVVLTDEEAVYAVIVNDKGTPLASFLKESDPVASDPVRRLWADRDPLAATRILRQSGRILEVVVPITAGERTIGSVTVGFSFDRMRRALLIQVILIGAALVLVSGASLFWLELALRRMLQPVNALTSAATQMSTGDLNVVLTGTDRKDELGVLSRAFESMAAQLRGLIAGMEQRMAELQHMGQALQQSEEEFRRIVATASEGIWVLGPDTLTTFVNPRMAEMLGRSPEEIMGRPMRDFLFDEDQADHARKMENRARGMAETYERRLRRPDGQFVWVHVSAMPIMDKSDRYAGSFAMFTDITARKQAEGELKRYRDHLEEEVDQRTADLILARNAAEAANKAKSVFLAGMSHELRTPLNAILGFSTMMRKDPLLPDSLRQYLDIINRSGEHLLNLINDVLEMAKIEAGRLQLESAPFDLGGMVRDVTDMMTVRAKEKGLTLLIDQSSEFPRYIVGDESRLRQVLINLVGNAIKFTAEGGVTVRLGTKQNRIAHLLIEVEDTGPGIPAEDQQRIFEPFVQLGEHKESKGTGLGLTITRQFVDMMGGDILLESTPGKGSLFRISLPLTAVGEEDIPKADEVQQGNIVGLAPGQPEYRILIVEDQLENQLLLSRLMESVGFRVKIADNGIQGIQTFQQWHPHLIWMDRKMPVMDGLEATKRIRALPGGKEVKIIAVTASAFLEQRAEMLAAGMDDFVRKPYRFDEIYDCLAKHLGVRYMREAPPLPEPTVPLTPTMFAPLPDGLRQSLKAALESLETDQVAAAIRQVGQYDGDLEKALTQYARRFDYPAILKTLEEA
ncbi:MAG TPA: ATP-binding protein [Rhodocyclaceae bacterium]|nr:ATP-binding protein [Rhodocyclaceae bacterium]